MVLQNFIKIFLGIIIASLISACSGPSRVVGRIPADKVTDISGRWNDSDARLTAEFMVRELLSRNWLHNFKKENDRKPILILGKIENRTSEHLDTKVFTKDIEMELINSGEVNFVASVKEREELREERMDQQSFSSVETAKELANEQASDFMLKGSIISVTDAYNTEKTILYKVSLELIDVEKNVKVWMGNKDIKKSIHQDRYRW